LIAFFLLFILLRLISKSTCNETDCASSFWRRRQRRSYENRPHSTRELRGPNRPESLYTTRLAGLIGQNWKAKSGN